MKLDNLIGLVLYGSSEIQSGDLAEFSDDGEFWHREHFFAKIPTKYIHIHSLGRGPDGQFLSIADDEVRRWNLIRRVRRCPKCDYIPESSHWYCAQCGEKLGA